MTAFTEIEAKVGTEFVAEKNRREIIERQILTCFFTSKKFIKNIDKKHLDYLLVIPNNHKIGVKCLNHYIKHKELVSLVDMGRWIDRAHPKSANKILRSELRKIMAGTIGINVDDTTFDQALDYYKSNLQMTAAEHYALGKYDEAAAILATELSFNSGVKFDLVALTKQPITAPDWAVENYFTMDSINEVAGPTGVHKTFWLFEIMKCGIARMSTYNHLYVKHGWSVYICGEGHAGLRKRDAAWNIEHGFAVNDMDLTIMVTTSPALLCNRGECERLERLIDLEIEKRGCPPTFIITDTIARNSGNEIQDMNRRMAVAFEKQDYLRNRYKACHIVVSHCVIGEKRGKFMSQFEANSDAAVYIGPTDTDNISIVENLKSPKDDDTPAKHCFTTKTKVIGHDDKRNKNITSLVVVEANLDMETEKPKSKYAGMGKNQIAALKLYHTMKTKTEADAEKQGVPFTGILYDDWVDQLKIEIPNRDSRRKILEKLSGARLKVDGEIITLRQRAIPQTAS